MKLFLSTLILLVLLPTKALASGKISAEPTYYLKSEKFGGQLGMTIYEHMFWNLNYNQWTGGGIRPRFYEDGTFWFASKHDIDFNFGSLTVSPGYKFEFNNAESELVEGVEHSVHVKVSYKLW